MLGGSGAGCTTHQRNLGRRVCWFRNPTLQELTYSNAVDLVSGMPAGSLSSSPPSDASSLQAFSRAASGGLSIPDPVLLARTAHLADTARSLPLLLADATVGNEVADVEGWADSPCLDLSDAAASFASITSIPRARVLASTDAEHPSPLALLFDDRTGSGHGQGEPVCPTGGSGRATSYLRLVQSYLPQAGITFYL